MEKNAEVPLELKSNILHLFCERKSRSASLTWLVMDVFFLTVPTMSTGLGHRYHLHATTTSERWAHFKHSTPKHTSNNAKDLWRVKDGEVSCFTPQSHIHGSADGSHDSKKKCRITVTAKNHQELQQNIVGLLYNEDNRREQPATNRCYSSFEHTQNCCAKPQRITELLAGKLNRH